VEGHLTAIHRQLLLEDGGKLVLNAALEHLAAGGDNGKLLLVEGQHVQDGLRPGSSLHGLHLLLLNDQRDDAGTSQLGSLFHRQVAVDRGDHHLGSAVHCQQGSAVDLEQTVAVSDQFDLALPGLGAVDVLTGSGLVEQGGSLVLVEDAGLFLPDIEVFLADAQQHRNILGLNDVALFEASPLELTRDDLGDIVAEHLPCRVFGTDQFHGFFLPLLQCRHLCSDPVGQRCGLVQCKVCPRNIPHDGQRLKGDRLLRDSPAHHLDLGPAALLEALHQHQIIAVALKQGQQILLIQAEFLRQQVAAA